MGPYGTGLLLIRDIESVCRMDACMAGGTCRERRERSNESMIFRRGVGSAGPKRERNVEMRLSEDRASEESECGRRRVVDVGCGWLRFLSSDVVVGEGSVLESLVPRDFSSDRASSRNEEAMGNSKSTPMGPEATSEARFKAPIRSKGREAEYPRYRKRMFCRSVEYCSDCSGALCD